MVQLVMYGVLGMIGVTVPISALTIVVSLPEAATSPATELLAGRTFDVVACGQLDHDSLAFAAFS